MDSKETRKQRVTRVARELSTELRRQARGTWSSVRTAQRNERDRHVWRFQPGPDAGERFLHIEHRAMVSGRNPAVRLLEQLRSERWLDRLKQGPETALLLSSDGELAEYTRG
jgi:hypothetical protein